MTVEDGGREDEGNKGGMPKSPAASTAAVGNTCPVNGKPGSIDRSMSSLHITPGTLEAVDAERTSSDSSDEADDGANIDACDNRGASTVWDGRGGDTATVVLFTGSTARMGDVSKGTVARLAAGAGGGEITTGDVRPDGWVIVLGAVLVVTTTAGLVFADVETDVAEGADVFDGCFVTTTGGATATACRGCGFGAGTTTGAGAG
jgi:hypothetical protein